MKTLILLTICTVSGIHPLSAQIKDQLAAIEKNNTTLKSLRESVEAEKLGNKTGIYLSNPEAGVNYLWGKPGETGNRTDINIKQNFDLPALLGIKSKVADGQNNLAELQYKVNRMNILLTAKLYCIELIYYNALKKELNVRLEHAETIAEGYKSQMEKGNANRLEYNKAQLNLSAVQGERSRVEVERNVLLSQLKRLNGGTDVVLEDDQYSSTLLPTRFEEWFAQAAGKDPALEYTRQETEVRKKQVSLNRAMNWPVFSAGYMSEKTVGQHYQGLTLGVSIPLWENKHRVKQAEAAVLASEAREQEAKQQLYDQLQMLHQRALGLKTTVENYRKALENNNNTDLVEKALQVGEISLLDYMLELGLYYDTVNQVLEAERDYQKALAELSAMEL